MGIKKSLFCPICDILEKKFERHPRKPSFPCDDRLLSPCDSPADHLQIVRNMCLQVIRICSYDTGFLKGYRYVPGEIPYIIQRKISEILLLMWVF